MRTRTPLMVVALVAAGLTSALPRANAQHAMPPAVPGGPSAHVLAERCAAAFERNIATGRGFGMAFAADQNGYPGPLHILELKDRLKLTAEQEELRRTLRSFAQKELLPGAGRCSRSTTSACRCLTGSARRVRDSPR